MKKFYTILMTALLTCAPAVAEVDSETFQFVDKSGNVVPDGSELTFNDCVVEDLWGDGEITCQVFLPIAVKNTADYDAVGSMKINILSMDNGEFQCCAFGDCMKYDVVGTYQRRSKQVKAGDKIDLQTEYLPTTYGQCTVELTVQEDDMGELLAGPTIKVHFVYLDPASVSALTQEGYNPVVARYTLGGQRLSQPCKGINVVRRADGSAQKILVK